MPRYIAILHPIFDALENLKMRNIQAHWPPMFIVENMINTRLSVSGNFGGLAGAYFDTKPTSVDISLLRQLRRRQLSSCEQWSRR